MASTDEIRETGLAGLRAVLDRPGETLLAVDFDGTLAPIVDDPERARAHPAAVAALSRLGSLLGAIVVITGRPVATAVRLGGFRDAQGLASMIVLGQYGVERWDAEGDRYDLPPIPDGVSQARAELPGVLDRLGLARARTEDKGRAVAVHTRELPDSAAAFELLESPLRSLANRHGLRLDRGRSVWELRAPGIDKGDALQAVVGEKHARAVIFAGDDLGDLPAFEAVERLRLAGVPGVLICSVSQEQPALARRADLVVDGPAGVAAWLGRLADQLEAPPARLAPVRG